MPGHQPPGAGVVVVAYDLGDHATALALFEERLTALRARAGAQGAVVPPRRTGQQDAERCPGKTIRALSQDYLQVYERIADRRHLAGTLLNLGLLVFEQGEFAAAQAFWEESLDRFREAGDRANTALALNNLAKLERYRGEYGAARAWLAETWTGTSSRWTLPS